MADKQTYREVIRDRLYDWLSSNEKELNLRQHVGVRLSIWSGSLVQQMFDQGRKEGVIPQDADLDDEVGLQGPDWESFFSGLTNLLEVAMPLLLAILKML